MISIAGEGTRDPDENPDRPDSYRARDRDRAHLDRNPLGSDAIGMSVKSHFASYNVNYRRNIYAIPESSDCFYKYIHNS